MIHHQNKIILDSLQPIYMGMDVHKATWSITLIHQEQVIFRATIPANIEGFLKLLESYRMCRILSVYEAGFSGFHLHYALERAGITNIITPPNKIPVLAGDRVKTDRIDSLKLATFLSKGLLKAIYVPSEEQINLRQFLRSREQLKRHRQCLLNQIKSLLFQHGIKIDVRGMSLKEKKKLETTPLPLAIRFSIDRHFILLDQVTSQMKALVEMLENTIQNTPYVSSYNRLQSVPGIGRLVAAALAVEIGDWRRFGNEKQISAFVGLTPSEYSSGESVRRGRITGQGNPWLRSLLIQSSWVLIQKDPAMKTAFERIYRQTGSKKKAIVAVARKLICRLLAMMKHQQDYALGLVA